MKEGGREEKEGKRGTRVFSSPRNMIVKSKRVRVHLPHLLLSILLFLPLFFSCFLFCIFRFVSFSSCFSFFKRHLLRIMRTGFFASCKR